MLNDLTSLGWKAFQDLCAAIASEVLNRPVQVFLPSMDGGRDGAFIGTWDGAPDDPAEKSTIQCKFTGKVDANLTLAQLQSELAKVPRLVKRGLAHDYIIMTNAGVSGDADASICEAFKAAGAKQCRVLGRNWIIAQLCERARLRMMVPRVYGIGDLTQILDERAYTQARYVLSAMGDDLRCFVPTAAYRQAVEALTVHGFVLLLGDPASGKSTIAAILALGALDEGSSGAIRITSPDQVERWNPNEKQFLWVDDAFGPNQYDANKVDGWNAQLLLLRAAIKQGARIVFTSRNYVWESARRQLRMSHFPLFGLSQIVVNVQGLTDAERAQILYNHIKFGGQPISVRKQLKSFLPTVAASPFFLPETARRLASPVFTTGLVLTQWGVMEFVTHPIEFLKEVLERLDVFSRAAIALIFLNVLLGLPSPIEPSDALETVTRLMGVHASDISRALEMLNGSLTLLVEHPDGFRWTFRHPTITDAFAALVADSPELVEIYIRGAKLERLFTEVVCGPLQIQGAKVRVPTSLYPVLLARLRGHSLDTALQRFLADRCDKTFLADYVAVTPEVFKGGLYPPLAYNRTYTTLLAKLHSVGLLPDAVRRDVADRIQDITLTWIDANVFQDADLRLLLTPVEFSDLAAKFKTEWIDDLEDTVNRWGIEYSSTAEASHFDDLRESLERAAGFFGGTPEIDKAFANAYRMIAEHISGLESEEHRPSSLTVTSPKPSQPLALASIFDDVDES
jgi:hypothetical protein